MSSADSWAASLTTKAGNPDLRIPHLFRRQLGKLLDEYRQMVRRRALLRARTQEPEDSAVARVSGGAAVEARRAPEKSAKLRDFGIPYRMIAAWSGPRSRRY